MQEHYERPRRRSNTAMMAALDGLARAFSAQGSALGPLRSAGLGAINAVGPVKQQIMKFAMGM